MWTQASDTNRIAVSVISLRLITEQVSSFGNAAHFLWDVLCSNVVSISPYLFILSSLTEVDNFMAGLQGVPRKVCSYSAGQESPPLGHIPRQPSSARTFTSCLFEISF
jgi:hypothetical protein